jgi:DNA-binding transcriptional LysR family regulator
VALATGSRTTQIRARDSKARSTVCAQGQTIRTLEARLDIRLLTRTTRSVAPTEAGERLAQAIGHRFEQIETELDALTAMRDKPAGTVRITCADHVLRTTIWPKLAPCSGTIPTSTWSST